MKGFIIVFAVLIAAVYAQTWSATNYGPTISLGSTKGTLNNLVAWNTELVALNMRIYSISADYTTITVSEAGNYRISAQVSTRSAGDGYFLIDGVIKYRMYSMDGYDTLHFAAIFPLKAGSTVQFRVDNGANIVLLDGSNSLHSLTMNQIKHDGVMSYASTVQLSNNAAINWNVPLIALNTAYFGFSGTTIVVQKAGYYHISTNTLINSWNSYFISTSVGTFYNYGISNRYSTMSFNMVVYMTAGQTITRSFGCSLPTQEPIYLTMSVEYLQTDAVATYHIQDGATPLRITAASMFGGNSNFYGVNSDLTSISIKQAGVYLVNALVMMVNPTSGYNADIKINGVEKYKTYMLCQSGYYTDAMMNVALELKAGDVLSFAIPNNLYAPASYLSLTYLQPITPCGTIPGCSQCDDKFCLRCVDGLLLTESDSCSKTCSAEYRADTISGKCLKMPNAGNQLLDLIDGIANRIAGESADKCSAAFSKELAVVDADIAKNSKDKARVDGEITTLQGISAGLDVDIASFDKVIVEQQKIQTERNNAIAAGESKRSSTVSDKNEKIAQAKGLIAVLDQIVNSLKEASISLLEKQNALKKENAANTNFKQESQNIIAEHEEKEASKNNAMFLETVQLLKAAVDESKDVDQLKDLLTKLKTRLTAYIGELEHADFKGQSAWAESKKQYTQDIVIAKKAEATATGLKSGKVSDKAAATGRANSFITESKSIATVLVQLQKDRTLKVQQQADQVATCKKLDSNLAKQTKALADVRNLVATKMDNLNKNLGNAIKDVSMTQWTVSKWSKCSAECGKGTRTRSVICQATECDKQKPVLSQECQVAICAKK